MTKPASPSWRSSARIRHGLQFVKFAFVGLAGTGCHYIVFLALVLLLDVAAGPAAFVGAAVGACVVYVLNHRYTFASKSGHGQTLPRFAAMALLGAVLNGFIVGWLTQLGFYPLFSQIVATVLILFINFVVSKLWIYR